MSGSGGKITITTGNSGESNITETGGDFTLIAGNGSAVVYDPAAGAQSNGGGVAILAGYGGDTLLLNYAGRGGDMSLGAGNGGTNSNQLTPIAGGAGGALSLSAGNGGSGGSFNAAAGAQGGTVTISAGAGGAGGGPGGAGGDAGYVILSAGSGGNRGDNDSIDGIAGGIQITAGTAPTQGGNPAGIAGPIFILGGGASASTPLNQWPNTGSNMQIGAGNRDQGAIGRFFVNADLTPGEGHFFPGFDVFAFVSGAINSRGTISGGVAVLGGDAYVSGNMYVTKSLYLGEFRNNKAQATNILFVSGTINTAPFGPDQRNAVFSSDVIMSGTIVFRSSSASPMNFIINGNSDGGIVFSGSLITIGIAGNTNAGGQSVLQIAGLVGAGQVPAVANKDVIFVVSGNVDGQGQSAGAVSLFRGDVVVSGNLYLGAGKKFTQYITIGSYASTTLTSSNPQVAGQAVLSQSEVPSSSIILRSVLSTTTGSVSASLKLFNVTSGSYVEIGGTGITTLGTVSTTPTQIQSVNLFSAVNFGTGSNIYEVRVYIGTGSQQAILGSSMFICR